MESKGNTYDIIVIGAGPAGLSAALYARRADKKTLVLEAGAYGGQIINATKLENYPGTPGVSGLDFASTLYQQVVDHGGEIVFEAATNIAKNRVDTVEKSYTAKAIIVATGTSHRKLGLAGEDRLIGRGISYCATCDGNLYKDKTVAVCGGGDTALTDALYLAGLAKTVYLIHRRNEFRGETRYVKKLKELSNVIFILNSNIIALNGEQKLESIIVKNSEKSMELALDGLFVAIGQQPSTNLVKDLIETDNAGYVISSDGVHTNIANIYVAGDVRQKAIRQVVTAVSDGAVAASTAIDELNKKES